ncbi:tyrosine-type recombinase/integrase [Sphingopyxis witflariensis]|uniref:Site-specific integrase n=1 Tax=Sphingopyxis witflariensis TaxID=173675 RepID=A0A2D0AMW3_9SPHN|nr:site-specific integrase [Sphingopyxis witflariensis]OWQ95101.1 site-specific integrase [Sphingopyxis witflariensis]
MASIRKRLWPGPDGTEKQAWIVDYRDGAGKRRFKQFPRKKDADAWLTSAAWEVSRGTHTADSQSVTVAQAANLWVKAAEANDRERGTIEQYKQLRDLHIVPLIGAEKLSRLSQPKVEAFRDQLLETRSRDMTGKAVRALSRILGDAQRRGLVAQNVARDVKVTRSKRDKPKVVIPAKEELKALLDNAEGGLKPLVMVAIFAGLRASELRGLRWMDVDLQAMTITVAQRADKYCQLGPPKSEAGYRTIPIGEALVNELRVWKLQCPKGDLGLAFPNSEGGVMDYSHLMKRRFDPLQVKAGVCDPVLLDGKPKLDKTGIAVMRARYGLHSLRHAAASAWIKQRIDLKRLQVWIGHENIELTLDTYGHLIADSEGDAALVAAAQAELLA